MTGKQALREKAGNSKIRADQADNMHFAITAGPVAQDPCIMWAGAMGRHCMAEDDRAANYVLELANCRIWRAWTGLCCCWCFRWTAVVDPCLRLHKEGTLTGWVSARVALSFR